MEYISREEINKVQDEVIYGKCIPDAWFYAFVKKIAAIPAADVAPVVRCKDCLYGSENGFICGNVHGLQYAFPNAFCSNGTKRE